ncbi:MAG: glutamate--tRNA ligase, partial [Alphaproteobacteria bacterium]
GTDTWRTWTNEIKKATGRKGKALYHPLRLALTGAEHGPELQNLLPMIERKRAVARLQGQTA